MDKKTLQDLQNISYDSIDKNNLIDVKDVSIDTSLNVLERLETLISKVKNPYILKCGNTIVEMQFTNDEKVIQLQLKRYLKSFKNR